VSTPPPNQFNGNQCVRVWFAQCIIGVEMVLEADGMEDVFYNQTYSVAKFAKTFRNGQIANFLDICNAHIIWDRFFVNDTFASGCGNITVGCGMNTQMYPLGCFEDPDVVPKCFTCADLNNCNGRGTCDRGTCVCNAPWDGDDCSSNPKCNAGCNGHGTCTATGCDCDKGWLGVGCNIEDDYNSQTMGHERSPAKVAIVLPIVIIVIAAAVAAGVFWYVRRRRNQGPQFTQLDLITAEEEDDDLAD